MPPKKSRYDWSWVGDISDPTEITDEHRLQAAGLTDLTPCTYVYPTCDPDIVPVKDKGCNKKKCQTNPRCLNYVGIARLLEPEPKGKEKYIEEKWDKPVQRADGIPAGLRNLGATCYVRSMPSWSILFHLTSRRTRSSSCGIIMSLFATGYTDANPNPSPRCTTSPIFSDRSNILRDHSSTRWL